MREEVHKENGVTAVRITADGGPGGMMPGGLHGPDDMLDAFLAAAGGLPPDADLIPVP